MNESRVSSIDDVIRALGGNKAVAKRFGVVPSAVSNWKKKGAFPAHLHLLVYRVCQEHQINYDPAAGTASAA